MRKVNFIRERKWENEWYLDTFEVEDSILNVEASLREAVKEFLGTEEGIEAVKQTMADFNWGDAIQMVPDEIWNKHGIYRANSVVEDIVVNQDETLCTGDEGYEETEDEVA
jgi:hypothetical protein